MKSSLILSLLFCIIFNNSSFCQDDVEFNKPWISIDSILKKQFEFQKLNKNTLVYLKDSIIDYYYDDVIKPCEYQPTKSYFTYNINGNIATKETKNTPEPGCEEDAYLVRETFSYNGNHPNNVTELLLETFDFDTNEWVNYTKKLYTYDINNNRVEEIWQYWNINTSTWNNSLKFENMYNVNLPLSLNRYSWDSNTSSWFWNLSRNYQYNANGNLLEYIYRLWNYSLNNWQTLRKTVNEYDTNENLMMNAEYVKYSTENQYEWNRIDITNFSYDTSNYLIQEIIYRDWNNDTENWDTKKKYNYSNNADGNPIETQIYLWNEATTNWDNDSQIFTTYNIQNDIIEQITQVWEANTWINSKRKLITYNSSNLWIEKLQEIWDNDWKNNVRESQTYNEFDHFLEYSYEFWYNNHWETEYHSEFNYDENQNVIYYQFNSFFDYNYGYIYYSEYDIELGIVNPSNKETISIVPNPSSKSISVVGVNKEVRITIYDMSGKLLLQSLFHNQIDISSLVQGLYIVKISSGDTNITRKLIKQ